MNIQKIAIQINKKSVNYRMGGFQEIRKKLKGFKRSSSKQLFSVQTIDEDSDWAIHHGGREEIQFNIGTDGDDHKSFRHGIAFSLDTSRSLPDINVLLPKTERFNDYVRETASEFSDMKMWRWNKNIRYEYPFVTEIPSAHFKKGNFIFLGKLSDPNQIDIDLILKDFDRLLNLYEYVEGNADLKTTVPGTQSDFHFKSGFTSRKSFTTADLPERRLNIELRHNDIQSGVYKFLVSKYGGSKVGTENLILFGKKVDIVVKKDSGNLVFFEIKTSSSLQSCFREAIPQLLEYAFWPNDNRAKELIIVTENDTTPDAEQYLKLLRSRFNLPIFHQKYDSQTGLLLEKW